MSVLDTQVHCAELNTHILNDPFQFLFCRLNHYNLQNPRGANAVMIKLIDSEDLMEFMNDMHGSPNIDITSVLLLGKSMDVSIDKVVSAPPQERADMARTTYFGSNYYTYTNRFFRHTEEER